MKVWKYQLSYGKQELRIPGCVQVLKYEIFEAFHTIWVLVNPILHEKQHTFILVYTGEPIPFSPKELKYIGTATDGLVYHLFEIK